MGESAQCYFHCCSQNIILLNVYFSELGYSLIEQVEGYSFASALGKIKYYFIYYKYDLILFSAKMNIMMDVLCAALRYVCDT